MHSSKYNKTHLFLLAVAAAVFVWSAIKPAGYFIWLMETVPAIVLLILVITAYNRFRLTTLSYTIIAILAILMFVGGHYTYSKVPLFHWLKDVFDWERNHYDRFGHVWKGFFVIVIRELLLRTTPLVRGGWLRTIAVGLSLAIAALYEIVEWLTFMVTKGEKATKDFLGTQGDIWDAQWDMFVLLIGSLAALLLLTGVHDNQLKRLTGEYSLE